VPLPRTHVILTERCRLRLPAEEDIPTVFSATRHPGFNDGMAWEAPASPGELRAPLERSLGQWDKGDAYAFSIDDRESGVFMGRISIRMTDRPGEWHIGYWLHPAFQGRGLMREAAAAVLRFGFEELSAAQVRSCYATWNVRSGAVLAWIGMGGARLVPEGLLKGGRWIPEFEVSIARGRWMELTAAGRAPDPGAAGLPEPGGPLR
jgi:ribosomal-protein-alanine N-acetyltransferase